MSAPYQSPILPPPPSAAARAGSLAARVLWTAIPFGTVGLLAWVPALHIARRRRTAAAWWWLVAHAAGTVVECVLVYTVPGSTRGSSGDAQAGAGFYCVGFFIAASVYAWRGCRAGRRERGRQQVAYPGYGASAGWSQTLAYPYPSSNLGPSPNPAPYPSPAHYPSPSPYLSPSPYPNSIPSPNPTPSPSQNPTPSPVAAPAPVPSAAANDMAAQIQAELRELRGFLGGGEAR